MGGVNTIKRALVCSTGEVEEYISEGDESRNELKVEDKYSGCGFQVIDYLFKIPYLVEIGTKSDAMLEGSGHLAIELSEKLEPYL